ALVFAYDAEWVTAIQPQGEGLSALWAAFRTYEALRELGLNVDIVPPGHDLTGYAIAVLPCLPIVSDDCAANLAAFEGPIVIGPRSGSKTAEFAISGELPPGPLQHIFPGKVSRSESLRPGVEHSGDGWTIRRWLDHLDTDAEPELRAEDGTVACYRHDNVRYCAGWPEGALIAEIVRHAVGDAKLPCHTCSQGLRLRTTEHYVFAFNYGGAPQELPESLMGECIIGDRMLAPAGVAVLRRS
ncbi:MAG: beta-galactosidase trimerization domain-containing protein, partial [Pontixanthobacter sp.]